MSVYMTASNTYMEKSHGFLFRLILTALLAWLCIHFGYIFISELNILVFGVELNSGPTCTTRRMDPVQTEMQIAYGFRIFV